MEETKLSFDEFKIMYYVFKSGGADSDRLSISLYALFSETISTVKNKLTLNHSTSTNSICQAKEQSYP